MDPTMCKNMDIAKLLELHESKTELAWRCPEFLVRMLEEGVHTDITFEAEGGSVKAHRSVLASMSPVFDAMFRHDMKEQLTSTVQISDMTIDSLRLFLLVLYTTNSSCDLGIPELKGAIDKNFEEFHRAVMKYDVECQIETLHSSALLRNLNPENCWVYYDEFLACRKFSASHTCLTYILRNYAEVIKSKSFLVAIQSDPLEVGEVIRLVENQRKRKKEDIAKDKAKDDGIDIFLIKKRIWSPPR